MNGFFVTGTDTEIGKTRVSVALLRHLAGQGHVCVGMKPVASGADASGPGGRLRNEDAVALLAASAVTADYDDVNPWVFAPATAPHLAAAERGVAIAEDVIVDACARLRRRADVVVVEGVGGWLVPLADGLTVESLAFTLGLPVIIVVGLRLGCINHALLTERAVLDSGVPLAGWVANHCQADFPRVSDNIATLRDAMRSPLLAELPWTPAGEGELVVHAPRAFALAAPATPG